MKEELTRISQRFDRQGLTTALTHLRNAESALQRGEWESANSQVRACLEAAFDEVARVRLKSTKTGGAARKLLESAGILGPREARLVQHFIDVAGGKGAHAGTSTEDEARGRFLAGLGICYIALAAIPEVVRVEHVLQKQLTTRPGTHLPTDRDIRTSCPSCGEEQTLGEAELRRNGTDTLYTCKNGCQVIVVVGLPGSSPWPGRGYRLGNHVIRNARDLYLPVIGSAGTVLIPASPAALKREN